MRIEAFSDHARASACGQSLQSLRSGSRTCPGAAPRPTGPPVFTSRRPVDWARISLRITNHHQPDSYRGDRDGRDTSKGGIVDTTTRPSSLRGIQRMLRRLAPARPAARTVGNNGPSSARPIRNGLLIALKAVPPHAAPARSVASAAAASAAAASAAAARRRRCSLRRRCSRRPAPSRRSPRPATLHVDVRVKPVGPTDPHHQPDHSRDDHDDNNNHQDARHNTPPSQQVPPLSALLPGSFRAPTPIATSSWVLFLVGYRSRRVLVSCCTPPQFAGQSVVRFLLLLVLGELVQTTAGKWITHPPTHCPNGRNLGVNQVLAGHQACLGHGGGHTTCRCHRCETTVYGPPLNTHCTALDGPATVRISSARD